jgi:hypothetical protein
MTYCYLCEKCGARVEMTSTLAEFKSQIDCCCGGKMGIDLVGQHKRTKDTPSNWPMESDAAGVGVEQVAECSKYVAERGVPTEFNAETGNPVFTSQGHRKRFCQVTGLYDRNASYGDATPRNNMRKVRRHAR